MLIEATKGALLIAPASLPWDIGNALSAALKRQRLTVGQAKKAILAYHTIPVRLLNVEIEESLALAGQWGIYAYDAYVLRCAQSIKAPLLSLDRRQQVVAQQIGLELLELEEV